jgi:hypothetical protein
MSWLPRIDKLYKTRHPFYSTQGRPESLTEPKDVIQNSERSFVRSAEGQRLVQFER